MILARGSSAKRFRPLGSTLSFHSNLFYGNRGTKFAQRLPGSRELKETNYSAAVPNNGTNFSVKIPFVFMITPSKGINSTNDGNDHAVNHHTEDGPLTVLR